MTLLKLYSNSNFFFVKVHTYYIKQKRSERSPRSEDWRLRWLKLQWENKGGVDGQLQAWLKKAWVCLNSTLLQQSLLNWPIWVLKPRLRQLHEDWPCYIEETMVLRKKLLSWRLHYLLLVVVSTYFSDFETISLPKKIKIVFYQFLYSILLLVPFHSRSQPLSNLPSDLV